MPKLAGKPYSRIRAVSESPSILSGLLNLTFDMKPRRLGLPFPYSCEGKVTSVSLLTVTEATFHLSLCGKVVIQRQS